jgi:hypothetical protein
MDRRRFIGGVVAKHLDRDTGSKQVSTRVPENTPVSRITDWTSVPVSQRGTSISDLSLV